MDRTVKLSCLLNVSSLALHFFLQSEHFPLIYCIEKLVDAHEFTRWESCFDGLGLDSKLVYDCYTSGLGTEVSFCWVVSYFQNKNERKEKLDVFIDFNADQ